MNLGKYIFSQITEFIPRHDFNKSVNKYNGNQKIRKLSCHDQFLAMMFGQLTNLKSLRGIQLCLNAHSNQLYHLGFRSKKFILSTIARANKNRDWKIYQNFAQILIEKTRPLYIKDNEFNIDLDGAPYVLDSTIIELSLRLFRWAKFEKTTSAVKIHTQLDLRGNIPSFFRITTAKVHDVNFLDNIKIEKQAYYIMDRGYFHFVRLYKIHKQKAYFIVRSKASLSFTRMYSNKVNKKTGLRCDQIIKLNHFYSRKDYPEKLRRIKYYDETTKKHYVYLTNDQELKAETIAELYKNRWQIELFFKWIKQHLKIEIFWGRSMNAIKTQICIAICTFLIIARVKKELKIKRNIHEILQILSVSQFEKVSMKWLLSEENLQKFNHHLSKQALLFDP